MVSKHDAMSSCGQCVALNEVVCPLRRRTRGPRWCTSARTRARASCPRASAPGTRATATAALCRRACVLRMLRVRVPGLLADSVRLSRQLHGVQHGSNGSRVWGCDFCSPLPCYEGERHAFMPKLCLRMPAAWIVSAPWLSAKLASDSALMARRCGARQVQPTAKNARNHSQCDSMLIGDTAGANTYPYIQARLF